MSKYGKVACLAAECARKGMVPETAWKEAANKIFPNQSASRAKSCPRCAFLGLAEEGLIVGVPSSVDGYTKSVDNKKYAVAGVDLLGRKPDLCDKPTEMWRYIMCNEDNKKKKHKNQMDVVVGLWKNGDIERKA